MRFFVLGVVVFVVLGVLISHQFPGLISTPKTSLELLEEIFSAPFKSGEYVARLAAREAVVVLFVKDSGLDKDVENRVVASLRSEKFRAETVPFLYYLFSMYGAERDADEPTLAELAYEEPPVVARSGGSRTGLSVLVARSSSLRAHVATALRLYDALFLRATFDVDPAGEADVETLGADALSELKAIFRDLAREMFSKSDQALTTEVDPNAFALEIEKILSDDKRLTMFVECFSDFVRDLSSSWLQSFLRTEERKDRRLEWVNDCIAANRYYEIADYARARSSRKLVFHLAVDGLQGKLLEGLAQLSMGNPAGTGARYVKELVALHGKDVMDPARYESNMPSSIGAEVAALVASAPNRPDFLETFKKYVFAPSARSVIVNVATSDTPTISVRNLPIIYSGHGVAGPFGTGIPNFSYLDRETGRGWYFYGSDVLYMRRIFGNLEDQIPGGIKRPEGPGARTLFERLWRYNTVSCMASVDMGALEKISSEVGVAVGELKRNFIEKAIVLNFRRRAEMERQLNERIAWLVEHRSLSRSLLGSLFVDAAKLTKFHLYARFLAEHEDEGLPDYVLWYNPWPDHFAHSKGPYSDEIIGYRGEYDRLDFYLGKMIDIYDSVKTADSGGSYIERTLFGIVSDHGLVYTPKIVSADDLLFGSMVRDGIDITYQKISADEGDMPVIHGRIWEPPALSVDAVVGSTAGGSYVIDVFDIGGIDDADGETKLHPGFHALREHRLRSGATIDLIGEIRTRLEGVMDIAVVREYGPGRGKTWPSNVESVVRVMTSSRGDVRIHRVLSGDGSVLYRYEVLNERDPLDLVDSVRKWLLPAGSVSVVGTRDALSKCIGSEDGVTDRKWSELLSRTVRPDVIYQLSHLYDSDRAGTINIFPLRHVGMNSAVPGRHAGESFGEKNATVLYFGAGLERARVQTARNGSLPVTLYHWLVGDEVFYSPDPLVGDSGASPAVQFGFRAFLDDPAFAPIRGVESVRPIGQEAR